LSDNVSTWSRLLTVEQEGGAPADPSGMSGPGTRFEPSTGRFTWVGQGAARAHGHQEGLLRWSSPLLSLLPGFDPAAGPLELGLDLATFPHTGATAGVFAGLQDSAVVDGALQAALGGICQAGPAQDQAWILPPHGSGAFRNVGLVDEAVITIQFTRQGELWQTQTSVRTQLESGILREGPVMRSGALRAGQLAQWRLVTGGFHRTTASLGRTALGWDVFFRRGGTPAGPLPARAPGPKPTSGRLRVLGLGDSIMDGVGAPGAGDGSDGLRFGGAPLPPGVTLTHDGARLTRYPDSGGTGPDAGYLPHLVQTAREAGFAEIELLRWSTPGARTAAIRAHEWTAAAHQAAAAGFQADLVLIAAGSNDSQLGENAGFETAAAALLRDLERTWPSARVCWIEPIALASGSYPEADQVRHDIAALVAAKPTRCRVPGPGTGRADQVHPSLEGYRSQGRAILPAYLAAT
jgi:lysophospholipase L1-like esterase